MANQPVPPRPTPARKRPFSVTLLAVGVLIFTVLNWLRLIESIRQWDLLVSYPISVSPLYLAVSGACWGLAGLPLVWGLYFGCAWVLLPAKIAVPFYGAYYWIDKLWLAQPAAIATRWPFMAAVTLAALAFTFWTLTRPKARQFFRQANA